MRAAALALIGAAVAAALGPTRARAQTQEVRLTATGALTSDILAYDVAYDGATIVAGAPFATYSGVSQPGRAFVFEQVGGAWVQVIKLQPPALQEGAAFGVVVAVEGNAIAIGTPSEDWGSVTNNGAVYLWEKQGGAWTYKTRLAAPVAVQGARFGAALAFAGSTLLVGANFDTVGQDLNAGAVYLFENTGGTWTPAGTITASDSGPTRSFGYAVAADGDTAIIGAPADSTVGAANAGSVYLFQRTGTTWTEVAKLTAATPTEGAALGYQVALRASIAVAGAYEEDAGGLDKSGAAYIFRQSGGAWAQAQRLTAPVPDTGDHFGVDVAIDGRIVLVGSYLESASGKTGVVHAFRESAGSWVHSGGVQGTDAGGVLYGWRLAFRGDRAVVGGPFYLTNRGAVYNFTGWNNCAADYNGDGFVDGIDYDSFNNDFEAGAIAADLNHDGFVDGLDADGFNNAFEAGC